MTRLKWSIVGFFVVISSILFHDCFLKSEMEFHYQWAKLHRWNPNSGNFDLVSNAKIKFLQPFSFSFSTNSYGFRVTPKYPVEEEWKTWLVGDSFVLGYGVNDEETISNQLDFPNLNLSLDAMGSQIAYEKIESTIGKIPHPKTIIWFYNSSDLIDDTIYKNGYKEERNRTDFLRNILISNRYFYGLFFLYKKYSQSKLPNQYDANEIIIPDENHPTFEGMNKIKNLCKEYNIKFFVVFLPEVIPKESEEKYWFSILSHLKTLGIDFLDYHKLYNPEIFHLPENMHPNSKAYEKIAKQLNHDLGIKIGNKQKAVR
jgi:hypothetical protein